MAASVSRKRSYIDESSPTSSKRFRRLPSLPPSPSFLDQLKEHFPAIASKVLENVTAQCGNDLEAAIAMLYKLGLEHEELDSTVKPNYATIGDEAIPSEAPTVDERNAANSEGLVELVVTELKNATSIDDAKARAARVLQNFKEAIHSRTTSETATKLQENLLLKEKLEVARLENRVLKRAVVIQHERQKGFADKVKEVQHMKQLVNQYQEHLRTLEVNNYALTMHLQQAQAHQSNFTHERFPPDVF